MKRQSKPEKIKKEKSTAPGEWLYFAPANVTVRSIYEVLTDDYEVEIWEDAGVLEIGLNDGATLDIEWTKIPAKDEITAAFAIALTPVRTSVCPILFSPIPCSERSPHAWSLLSSSF